MKKIMIVCLSCFVFCWIAVNTKMNVSENIKLTDQLTLKNVEALANTESGGKFECVNAPGYCFINKQPIEGIAPKN